MRIIERKNFIKEAHLQCFGLKSGDAVLVKIGRTVIPGVVSTCRKFPTTSVDTYRCGKDCVLPPGSCSKYVGHHMVLSSRNYLTPMAIISAEEVVE